MTSRLNPYISFDGTAREALERYQEVFGGEMHAHTFGQFGAGDGEGADGIMHGQLETPSGYTLMVADTPPGMPASPEGSRISVSLSGDRSSEAELRGYFDALAEGGNVTMPLEPQMWGDTFGMVTDKFGVSWMVNIAGPEQAQPPA